MRISPARVATWAVATALLIAMGLLFAGCGGGSEEVAVNARTLASGLGALHGVALTDSTAYVVEETESGSRILAVPLTTGSATEVATATGDIISPAAYGTGCVYIDVAEMTVNYVASGSASVVLNRSTSSAPRACDAASGTVCWIDGAGARLISLEIAADPGSSDPPPPLSFPEVIADTDNAVLLAAASDRLWLADQNGARLSRVALTGGAPVASAASIGTVHALAASGTTIAAAGAGRLYTGTETLVAPGSATLIGAGIVSTGVVCSSEGAVFLAETGGTLQRMATATSVSGLDARGTHIVVAENPPAGGRVRLLTLPTESDS
jgi:hypothetical protein